MLIGGGEFDSGLPRTKAELDKLLEEAKKAGDTERVLKIIKQLKVLNLRNIGKLRGQGNFRMPFFLFITPQQMDPCFYQFSGPNPACKPVA